METPLVKLSRFRVAKSIESSCLVLADANFPSASIAKQGPELVRADGE